MTERLIFNPYELRGGTFEVWSDGRTNPGGYPNWWLATEDKATAEKLNVPVRTVLIESDFTPPLTEREITDIGEAVLDSYMD